MLNFKVDISRAIDTKKIQEIAAKAAVNILVGFPSGRQHVPTLHKNPHGQYESYDHGDPQQDKPIETSELAKALHFGTALIPARPFLEEGIESKKHELKLAMKAEAKKAIDGGSPNWTKIGTMAVGAVEEFVRSDHYRSTVPNSPRTVEYKGSDLPLIDGGDLLNSLSFVINDGGTE